MSEKASVKLSTKSWHYKFMKFVLGQLAPTPGNMHNLCPYFWLLIFSILVFWFVIPLKYIFKSIGWIFEGIIEFTEKYMIIPACETYEEELSDLELYEIIYHGKKLKRVYASFNKVDNKYNYERKEAAYELWKKKYGSSVFKKPANRNFYGEYTKKYEKWVEEQERAYQDLMVEKAEINTSSYSYEEKLSDFRGGVDDWFTKVRDNIYSYKNIIKWTKRISGAIVTGVLLLATYFAVNFIGRGILWLVEHWDWKVFLGLTIALAITVVIIGLFFLLRSWVYLINEKGLKLWYAKLIYYPLYYLVYWPLTIIFYHFIWQLILLNVWYFLKKGAQLIWGSFLGFLGIFGEYFGASYTDYCPGIEWEEKK